MKNELLDRLLGGFVRLHILYHADKEPICGMEIIEELGRHGYDLSPGTLYPILHRLETSGYIRQKVAVIQGKQRKNYRITPHGRKLLREAKVKLQELVSEVVEDHGGRRPKEH